MIDTLNSILLEQVKYEKTVLISVIGGGGKTTFIESMANHCKKKSSVLITTTTAMFYPCASIDEYYFGEDFDFLLFNRNEKKINHCEGLYSKIINTDYGDKAIGLSVDKLDALSSLNVFDLILVEADGAKRKPLKAYAMHEPVIPKSSQIVVVVMGLKALDQPIDEGLIHRSELFCKLVGKDEGALVSIEDYINAFNGEEGFLKGVPEASRIIVLLNQSDLLLDNGNLDKAILELDDISKRLFAFDSRIETLVLGSLRQKRLDYIISRSCL